LLDRAAALEEFDLPPSSALWHDRATYLRLLGDEADAQRAEAQAKRIPASSAGDHYLLAATDIREGDYKKAIAHLHEAVHLNPEHYWSFFQRGMCYKAIGEYTLAAADFSTCIGLWPEFAWSYFNRGFVLHEIGRKENAYDDYTAALERDDKFANAYINRALVSLERQQFAKALADYDRAAALDRDNAALYAGRGIALEGLGRFQEADEAFEAAFARLDAAPAHERSRIRWTYGFA